MARIAAGRMGRRRFRRPAWLVAIGLTVGLGVVAAVAAAAMMTKTSRYPAVHLLSLRVAPSSQTVEPGGSVAYAVRVEAGQRGRWGLSGRTQLSVGGGIPSGSTVSFSPQAAVVPLGTSHRPSRLTIQTSAGTAPGSYSFQVRARRPRHQGRTTVTLIVSAAGTAAPTATPPSPSAGAPTSSPPPVRAPEAFTISGTLSGLLIPGSGAPLDLSLANLEGTDLSITGLTVRVAAVTAPRSDALHPCSPADFSVAQFSGTPGFTLPASSTATLGQLGFGPAEWPQITMLDSAVNQNGCKSASLQLGFAGTATEVSP